MISVETIERRRLALPLLLMSILTVVLSGASSCRRPEPDARQLLLMAEESLQQDDADTAIATYEQALRKEPYSAQARIGLAIASFSLNQTVQGLRHYAAGMRLDPDILSADSLEQIIALTETNPTILAVLEEEMTGQSATHTMDTKTRTAALDLLARSHVHRFRKLAEEVETALQNIGSASPDTADSRFLPPCAPPDFEGLARVLHRQLSLVPDSSAVHNLLLKTRQAQGVYGRARVLFSSALRVDPAFSPSAIKLARLESSEGKPDIALSLLHGLLDLKLQSDMETSVVKMELARLLRRLDRDQEALDFVDEVLKTRPSWWEAFLMRVVLLADMDDLWQAILEVEPVAESNPDNRRIQHVRSALFAKTGVHKDTADNFDNTVAVFPDWAEGHFLLALAHYHLNDTEKAMAALLRAVRIEPDHVEARCSLAALLIGQGAYISAAGHLRELLSSHPDNADALYLLGAALGFNYETAEAISVLDMIERGHSRASQARQLRSALMLASGDSEKLITELLDQIENAPQDFEIHYLLGFARLTQLDFDSAQEEFAIAARLRPKDPLSHLYLCRIGALKNDVVGSDVALSAALNSHSQPNAIRLAALVLGKRDALPALLSGEGGATSKQASMSELYLAVTEVMPSERLLSQLVATDIHSPTVAAILTVALKEAEKYKDSPSVWDNLVKQNPSLLTELSAAAETHLLETMSVAPTRISQDPCWWDIDEIRLPPKNRK